MRGSAQVSNEMLWSCTMLEVAALADLHERREQLLGNNVWLLGIRQCFHAGSLLHSTGNECQGRQRECALIYPINM